MIFVVNVIFWVLPDNLFQKSVTTMKPNEPNIDNKEIIILIDVLSLNCSKLSLYKPKPAVQKEETL